MLERTFERSRNSLLPTGDVEASRCDGIVAATLERLGDMNLLEQRVGTVLRNTAHRIATTRTSTPAQQRDKITSRANQRYFTLTTNIFNLVWKTIKKNLWAFNDDWWGWKKISPSLTAIIFGRLRRSPIWPISRNADTSARSELLICPHIYFNQILFCIVIILIVLARVNTYLGNLVL